MALKKEGSLGSYATLRLPRPTLGLNMNVNVTIKGSNGIVVSQLPKNQSKRKKLSTEERELAKKARKELRISKKGKDYRMYRARKIAIKEDVSVEEALTIVASQDKMAKKAKVTKKPSKTKKSKSRTTYTYGGYVIKNIVSGGGGPGTAKRK